MFKPWASSSELYRPRKAICLSCKLESILISTQAEDVFTPLFAWKDQNSKCTYIEVLRYSINQWNSFDQALQVNITYPTRCLLGGFGRLKIFRFPSSIIWIWHYTWRRITEGIRVICHLLLMNEKRKTYNTTHYNTLVSINTELYTTQYNTSFNKYWVMYHNINKLAHNEALWLAH